MALTTLLIIVFVSGYTIAVTWDASRYYAAREEGHRLYFRSAFYGLLAAALGLALFFLAESRWPGVHYQAGELLSRLLGNDWPSRNTYVALGFWTFAAGVLAGPLLNLFGNLPLHDGRRLRQALLRQAVERTEHQLDVMVLDAIENERLLSFSLRSGKVYIGRVISSVNPGITRDFRIVPLLSGYRGEDLRVQFTTPYYDVYDALLSEDDADWRIVAIDRQFGMVIPVSEIVSVGFFDPLVYERHFRAPV